MVILISGYYYSIPLFMQHNHFPCLNIYLIDKSTLIEYRHTKLNQNMLDHDRRIEKNDVTEDKN